MYGNTRAWLKFVYAFLGVAALLAVGTAVNTGLKDVRIETREVAQAIKSYAALEEALGAPVQTLPGAELNDALAGATCGVWQLDSSVIIGCR